MTRVLPAGGPASIAPNPGKWKIYCQLSIVLVRAGKWDQDTDYAV
jgi:hypothetical protein